MRPIKLGIEGFTSFRQPSEIDLESLDLFAITGPTGAGKTSIIDAIIYALYGRTPRIGGSCSELISQGAERLRVYLQFKSNEKKYQIVRTIKNGGTTKVNLEVLDEKGEWEALSNKVADVREQIDEIIGIDFEGFIKSVVLPQGEFDRFLRGETPDRRHIISELLSLNVYVEMGRIARQRADDARREAALLEQHLAEAYANVTKEKQQELTANLKVMGTEQQHLTAELKIIRELHPIAVDLQHWRKAREQVTGELDIAKSKLQTATGRAESAKKELALHAEEIAKVDRAIQRAGYDDNLCRDLLTIVPLARRRDDLRVALVQSEKEHFNNSKEIDEEEPALVKAKKARESAAGVLEACEKRVAGAKEAYSVAKKKHGSADTVQHGIEDFRRCLQMQKQKADLQTEVDDREAGLKLVRKRIVETQETEKKARTACEDAERQLDELRQLHAVDGIRRQLKRGLPCPVCEQVVSAVPKPGKHELLDRAKEVVAQKQALVEKAHEAAVEASHLFESLPGEIKKLKKQLGTLDSEIGDILTKLERILGKKPGSDPTNELARLGKELSALEESVEEAAQQCSSAADKDAQSQKSLTKLEHKLDLLRQKGASLESDINEKKRELNSLEKALKGREELASLEKQLATQEKAREQAQNLEEQKRKEEKLQGQAAQKMAVARTEVSTFEQRIGDLQLQMSKADSEAEALAGKIRRALKLQGSTDEAREVESRRSTADRQTQDLVAKIALEEAELARVKKGLVELGEKRRQIKSLQEVIELNEELGAALRADRFIRFVEEEAMERLAQDGSEHLSRLSSGRYEFLAKDENFFVLDHWNADDTRSVNTLSGGESFLASLALALALSDTLAEFAGNRASFSLDSLFLDEGFSTLDPETLDVVVQGIEALAGGHRMIGVISHVPELAERFPVQIQVKKSVGGSTIHISGSGGAEQTLAEAR